MSPHPRSRSLLTRPSTTRLSGFSLIELAVVVGILLLLVALLLPATRGSREPRRRTQCRNMLKQIGLALHNYYDTYGSFPPAMTVDADGQPLHSWRTLILPYFDQQSLYDTIDLSKPWNDPVNAVARETAVPGFRCPSIDTPPNHTTYLGVLGDEACFPTSGTRTFAEVTDGSTKTWMVIEADPARSVPWMSPQDADADFLAQFDAETNFAHSKMFHALYLDGSVRGESAEMSHADRTARITIAGGESVPER